MTRRGLTQELVDAALAFGQERFGENQRFCVAAVLTDSGRTLVSVYFDAAVEGASLCAETGAICEAEKLGEKIIASVCIGRSDPSRPPYILPACGVCQERLARWGSDVEVAVPVRPGSLDWTASRLSELQPFHWARFKSEQI
jgi:cytidine deaminase